MTDATYSAHTGRAEQEPHEAAPYTASAAIPDLNWKWMLAAGVIYVIGGVAALLNPFFASLFAQALISAAFIIGGTCAFIIAIRNQDGTTGGRILSALSAFLAIALGFALWISPLIGLLSLTMTVASFLVVMGGLRIWLGLKMRQRAGWGWFVGSGVLSILLAAYIFATLPASALSALGLFLAFELVFAGAAHITAALQARAAEQS